MLSLVETKFIMQTHENLKQRDVTRFLITFAKTKAVKYSNCNNCKCVVGVGFKSFRKVLGLKLHENRL